MDISLEEGQEIISSDPAGYYVLTAKRIGKLCVLLGMYINDNVLEGNREHGKEWWREDTMLWVLFKNDIYALRDYLNKIIEQGEGEPTNV